ncbi:hypothetical protein UC35_18585 [Ramlibacter tataouinensis]|uniref:DUF3574 domain-containing protein n=2 Tax=Ramlibacter tataouinensis TaxID=94132 RepID=A0A127K0B5_9BURK|nr:hypothetical protein UC35_18585 [Ramlibacter tataouinensis]
MACVVGACAAPAAPVCTAGESRSVIDQLYFGTARPSGGTVTADQWAEFLGQSVTPRFPQGLTHWPASGQWQGRGGGIVTEGAWVLTLVHADDTAADAAVRAVMADYKSRFDQEAVLRTRSHACTSL